MMLSVPLLAVVSAPEALACSCAPMTFPTYVERADVVFSGRAIDREEASGGVGSSVDPVTWMFLVDRQYKGAARTEQEVISAQSEASCGFEFEVGTAYLVFAAEQSADGARPMETGLCNGTRSLSDVPAGDVQTLGPGERPAAVTEPVTDPVAEANPWGPWLVTGFGAVIAGGFLSAVALWRRRNRV